MMHTSKQGFTLIETMVAIAIIGITLVAPFEAIENSLTASNTSRDELIGSMLDQEAIEYVRQVRDDNYLTSYHGDGTPSWLYGFDGSTFGGTTSQNCFTKKCTVDPTPLGTLAPIAICNVGSTGACLPLYLSTTLSSYPYFYTENQAVPETTTSFTRSIQLTYTNVLQTEVEVTATTSWSTDHISSDVVIHEYLDNWLP